METAVSHAPEPLIADADPRLYNHDLAPVPQERRTWETLHYMALWVGMCINIPSYMIASSLIQGGMNMLEAVLTVFLGNTIVLVPMILNGHVGVKYGIPFPIYARLSFGVFGANLPALLRAIVACGWFGIQCWIGGSALMTMLTLLWPEAATLPAMLPSWMGVSLVPFACFLVFWGLNVLLLMRGIETIKKLETYCAPVLLISGVLLMVWAFMATEGIQGGLWEQLLAPDKFGSAAEFWTFFFPALTGMVGFWATLSLNIPDFTRYAKNQRAQIMGQALGLPTTMTLIAAIGVVVTTATVLLYGKAIWDPVQVISRFDSPVLVFLAMGVIALATLAMNVAANVVAPANDFANLWPSHIDFKRGGLLTAVLGMAMMPWKLIADPSGYIFTWLIGYSALLGPLAGIMLVDYFWIRKTQVLVDDLYRTGGAYDYRNGVHWAAMFAFVLGVLPNLPGFLVQINAVDVDAFPAFCVELYHYAWFIGVLVSGVLYAVFAAPARTKTVLATSAES